MIFFTLASREKTLFIKKDLYIYIKKKNSEQIDKMYPVDRELVFTYMYFKTTGIHYKDQRKFLVFDSRMYAVCEIDCILSFIFSFFFFA